MNVINNSDYEHTNNMYSLFLAKNYVNGSDFLLMNADVYFDANIITGLINLSGSRIACDKSQYLDESMKIKFDGDKIISISKKISSLDYYAVSIDVYKISAKDSFILFDEIQDTIINRHKLNSWTEVALDKIFAYTNFQPYIINGRWFEIDNHDDLAKAQEIFKPDLKSAKLFMLDMDGTIYNENELIPGAREFFDILNARKIPYIFMTNNSSKNKADYVEKLNSLGIIANEKNIASSVNAVIRYLNINLKSGAKLYLVGTESFKQELLQAGYKIVPSDYRGSDIDCVVLGFDTELNYSKILGACYYVSRNYKYIATNCDLKCPVLDNKFIPDCGAIAKMIELAAGRTPIFIGKPNREMIDSVASEYNISNSEIVCVGDRLYTDIAAAKNAGAISVCVLTGEATRQEISESEFKPDYCFDSIKNLYEALL